MSLVPTYDLYGETGASAAEFWVHSESISSRSSRYGWEIKPHRHEAFFQILHIREGSSELLAAPDRLALSGAAVMFAPPGHEHGFHFSPDIDGSVLTLLAPQFSACREPPADIAAWLSRPRAVSLEQEHPDRDYLVLTLTQIEREIVTGAASAITLIESLLPTALTLSLRISGDSPEGGGDRDRTRLLALERMITQQFKEHQPVAHYARALGVSVTHLNRITTMLTGKPVSRLIAERIIIEAKRELTMTRLSIGDIADSLGFEDQAYFSRFFSRNTGLSPRHYRERSTVTSGERPPD